MAPSKSDRVSSKRRMRGFERANGLLARQVAKAGEGRGFAVSRLLTHWADVAGPELAKATRPVRVTYGRGGMGATLVLLVRGSEAPMIQAELPKLKDRVNACYGYAAVSRIQLTQTAPTGFAEGQAVFSYDEPRNQTTEPDEAAKARGQNAVKDIENSELRLALSQMGAHILQDKPGRKA